MSFRFTAEDFERYVKAGEHGGQHIWHHLQDRLEQEFGIPFAAVPYIARGDRLQTLWFAPRGIPRPKWDNQAQFFLSRSLEKKNFCFGLMIECPTVSDIAQYGYDPDRDALRLLELLENDAGFAARIDALVSQPGWTLGVNEWNKTWHTLANSAQLLQLLKGFPEDQGWGADIEVVLTAEEAIAAGDAIVDQVMDAYRTVRPFWEAVLPVSVRTQLESGQNPSSALTPTAIRETANAEVSLSDYFAARGFHFAPRTLATYFTALQTKGFVILSGLSGSGKTKLAQHFAGLLQSDNQVDNYQFLSVRPDWRDGKPLLGYYNPLTEQYETSDFLRFVLSASQEQSAPRLAGLQAWLQAEVQTSTVRQWVRDYRATSERLQALPTERMTAQDLDLLWQAKNNGLASVGPARPLKASEEELRSATEIIRDQDRTRGQRLIKTIRYIRGIPGNVTPWARTLRALSVFDPVSTMVDYGALGKLLGLLGYERPFRLDRLVEAGDAQGIDDGVAFLEAQVARLSDSEDPVVRAVSPWLIWGYLSAEPEASANDVLASEPFFVLLDEMNISRVEYYFAEFLSVLEGGRDQDGFTTETLKLHGFAEGARYQNGQNKPCDSDGRYVPPELRLPPNLYFVGTVNVDETTHAFSPKVLDRAFTIEITDVDFEQYPAATGITLSEDEIASLHQRSLPMFTRNGRFGIIDKAEIRTFVADHPEYRVYLRLLNQLLQPYDLHFAYRVFDEIVAFCANAEANGLWTGLGGLDAAFDCAVLMKVLPKFHGPRSKLEEPLRNVLAWALDPGNAESVRDRVVEDTKDAAACLDLRRELDAHLAGGTASPYRVPNTARKAVRMLQSLHTVGFASFA